MHNYVTFFFFHGQLLSKLMPEFVVISSISLYWHRTELKISCHIPLDAKHRNCD